MRGGVWHSYASIFSYHKSSKRIWFMCLMFCCKRGRLWLKCTIKYILWSNYHRRKVNNLNNISVALLSSCIISMIVIVHFVPPLTITHSNKYTLFLFLYLKKKNIFFNKEKRSNFFMWVGGVLTCVWCI